jgi:hypothetical protein
VDIQKNYYGDYITNVYHVDTTNMSDAIDAAEEIAVLESKLFVSTVNVDAIRVSTPAPGDNIYNSGIVNIPGTRSAGSPDLPPFARFRVDMSVGFTRPLRKFLLGAQQDDASGGGFTSAAGVFVATNYITPLIALGVVCSPSGSLVVSGALNARVGMRQLKRASKRTTPTI